MIASLVDKIFFLTIATLFEKSSLFIKKEEKKSDFFAFYPAKKLLQNLQISENWL